MLRAVEIGWSVGEHVQGGDGTTDHLLVKTMPDGKVGIMSSDDANGITLLIDEEEAVDLARYLLEEYDEDPFDEDAPIVKPCRLDVHLEQE